MLSSGGNVVLKTKKNIVENNIQSFQKLTSMGNEERDQVILFFSEHFGEFMEIRYTSATEKVQYSVIAVTPLWSVDNVISLWPRDTSSIIKLSDKHNVGVNTLQ